MIKFPNGFENYLSFTALTEMANYTGGLTEMQKNLKRYRLCKHNTG